MSELRAERCETCKFWDREWYKQVIDERDATGFCNRFPRTEVKESHDWCGEWQSIGPDLRHVGTKDAPS